MANILNRQYQSVFTQEEPGEARCPDGLSYPDITEFTVTASGIQKVLQHLNPRKAAGPDNLSVCFLKECAIEIAPNLAVIFNKSPAKASYLETGEMQRLQLFSRRVHARIQPTTDQCRSPVFVASC